MLKTLKVCLGCRGESFTTRPVGLSFAFSTGSLVVPYMCLSWTLAKLGGGLTFITLACLCCSCVSRRKNGAMNGVATSISYFAR